MQKIISCHKEKWKIGAIFEIVFFLLYINIYVTLSYKCVGSIICHSISLSVFFSLQKKVFVQISSSPYGAFHWSHYNCINCARITDRETATPTMSCCTSIPNEKPKKVWMVHLMCPIGWINSFALVMQQIVEMYLVIFKFFQLQTSQNDGIHCHCQRHGHRHHHLVSVNNNL